MEKSSGALFRSSLGRRRRCPKGFDPTRRRLGKVMPQELAKDLTAKTLKKDIDEDDI